MDRPELGPESLSGMRVLKTRSPEAKDREELPSSLGQPWPSELSPYRELLDSLEAGWQEHRLVVLRAPARQGKSYLIREYLKERTRSYRDRGQETVWLSPGSSLSEWLRGPDTGSGRFPTTPWLNLWLRALRHKAKLYFLVLEGVEGGRGEGFSRLLRQVRDLQDSNQSLWLHDESLRCQAKEGPPEEVVKFFVCQQPCEECFFVRPGYPRGVTGAVRDFVPARVVWPSNLKVIVPLRSTEGPVGGLEGAWTLELPPRE